MAVHLPDGALLWVDGHLRLQRGADGRLAQPQRSQPSAPPVHALVMGDAQVHCALLRQTSCVCQHNLSVHTRCCGAMARQAASRCWASAPPRWGCSRAVMRCSGTNRPALTSRCKMPTQRAIRRGGLEI